MVRIFDASEEIKKGKMELEQVRQQGKSDFSSHLPATEWEKLYEISTAKH